MTGMLLHQCETSIKINFTLNGLSLNQVVNRCFSEMINNILINLHIDYFELFDITLIRRLSATFWVKVSMVKYNCV